MWNGNHFRQRAKIIDLTYINPDINSQKFYRIAIAEAGDAEQYIVIASWGRLDKNIAAAIQEMEKSKEQSKETFFTGKLLGNLGGKQAKYTHRNYSFVSNEAMALVNKQLKKGYVITQISYADSPDKYPLWTMFLKRQQTERFWNQFYGFNDFSAAAPMRAVKTASPADLSSWDKPVLPVPIDPVTQETAEEAVRRAIKARRVMRGRNPRRKLYKE